MNLNKPVVFHYHNNMTSLFNNIKWAIYLSRFKHLPLKF